MMGKKGINEQIGNEFFEFIEAEESDPPLAISEKIRETVERDLSPVIWKVLLKFGIIQAAVASITLLVCPQFEIDPGFIRHDDAHLRTLLGEAGYMALCGAIFLTSGSVTASILLRIEELRAIKKSEYICLFIASVLALMIFSQLGTPAVPASYAAWFAGAFIGSAAGFDIVKRLRLNRLKTGYLPSI